MTLLIGGAHQELVEPKTNGTVLDYVGLSINRRSADSIFLMMRNARIARHQAGIES